MLSKRLKMTGYPFSLSLSRLRGRGGWGLLFFVFLSGCALQSSLVGLEEEIGKIQKTQQEFVLRAETLEKEIEALSATLSSSASSQPMNVKGTTALLGEIDRLETQLRTLEGLIEKGQLQLLQATQRMDNQAHRTDLLLGRVDAIEQRLVTKESEVETPGAPTSQASPTEAYNLAYNDYLKGNYDLAILSFQNYLTQYPNSNFVPQAIFWIGQSHYNKGAYPEAITFFEQIGKNYPDHDRAPNALFKTALSLIELGKLDDAKERLKKVIAMFPESNESNLAKDRLASLP